ncbi:MAG: HAMP domain-containing protein, partial [Verrucomicrobiaceae bacterium]
MHRLRSQREHEILYSFMRTSIGMKIGAGYALALVVLIIIGITSFISVTRLVDTVGEVNESYQVLIQTEELRSNLVNIETGQRGYVVTEKEEFLEPYKRGLKTVGEHIPKLRQLTVNTASQQQLLDRLETLVAERVAFSQQVVELQMKQDHAGAVERTKAGEGRNLMDEIRQVTNQLEEVANARLKKGSEESNANARHTILTIVLGALFASVLLGLIGFLTVRSISKPLREIAAAAERIASGDLDVRVRADHRGDEVGILAQAFGRMISSLQE